MALLGTLTANTIRELQSVSSIDEAAMVRPDRPSVPGCRLCPSSRSLLPRSARALQVEPRVGALCDLIQQAGTRLSPAAAAAATDAALALLSGLQAARLRLAASPPAAAVLERSSRQLLGALQQSLGPATSSLEPPAAVAAPQPPTDGGSRQSELSSLVGSLGFSTHDWQAAQATLAHRTNAALAAAPQRGSGSAAVEAAAGSGERPSEPALSALDSLLRTAVSSPAWHPGSGEASLLHGAMADLLWVLRQSPSPAELPRAQQPQVSSEGWAAYWVLEPRVGAWEMHHGRWSGMLHWRRGRSVRHHSAPPTALFLFCALTRWDAPAPTPMQALQQALAEVLQAATHQQAARAKQQAAAGSGGGNDGWLADPQQLLDSQPHWAATAAAVAYHPALHLLARRTLHSWLTASGNPAAWHLVLHLMQAARSCEGAAQQLLRGQLPVALQVLYPPGLAAVAALLHTQQPTDTRLGEAVTLLEQFLEGGSEASQPALTAAHAATVAAAAGLPPPADLAVAAAAAAERRQQVWQLQLDAPGWLLFCLNQLPLDQLLELAGQGSGGASGAAGPATRPAAAAAQPPSSRLGSQDLPPSQEAVPLSPGAAASLAAARYAALALWPLQPLLQRVLEEALQLQLGDVDLAATRPWLEALHSWRPLLAAAEAAAAAGGAAAEGQDAPMNGAPAPA